MTFFIKMIFQSNGVQLNGDSANWRFGQMTFRSNGVRSNDVQSMNVSLIRRLVKKNWWNDFSVKWTRSFWYWLVLIIQLKFWVKPKKHLSQSQYSKSFEIWWNFLVLAHDQMTEVSVDRNPVKFTKFRSKINYYRIRNLPMKKLKKNVDKIWLEIIRLEFMNKIYAKVNQTRTMKIFLHSWDLRRAKKQKIVEIN
jgi:hypothetical protein